MMVTTILLDAGGVILDEVESEAVKAEVIIEALANFVLGYSIENYYADIEEAVKSFCPDAYSYVLWKHSHGDIERFDCLYKNFREEMSRRDPPLKLSEGFADEIRAISKNYAVAIAGQYGNRILDLLERESILGNFTHHFTQDDFSITKPDPRYYQQICDACGVDPRQCIMVGDRIDKDIIPAKMLGMKTILIRTGLHKNQQTRIPSEIPDMELIIIKGLASAIQNLAAEP